MFKNIREYPVVAFSMFLVFILAIVISLRLYPFAFDDAYIHFRIAENFANHSLPYFNTSEPVLSTSSFPWICIIAILVKLHFSLPISVAIINAILAFCGSYIWSEFLQEPKRNCVLQIIFQIIYLGILLPSMTGLMEIPFSLLLLGLAIRNIKGDKIIGWSFLAIAVFTRYEFFVFAIVVGLYELISDIGWKNKLKSLLFFIIPFTVIVAVLLFFFDTIVPNTIYAKKLIYFVPIKIIVNNILLSIFTIPNFSNLNCFFMANESLTTFFSKVPYIWKVVIVVNLVAVIVYHSNMLGKKNLKLISWNTIIFFGGIGIAIGYIWQRVFLFDWYLPLYLVPISIGIFSLLQIDFKENKDRYARGNFLSLCQRICITSLSFLFCVQPLTNFLLYSYSSIFDLSKVPSAPMNLRVQRYIEVGQGIYSILPNATLLTNEIGGLGYSFKGKIIDAAGLISPELFTILEKESSDQNNQKTSGTIPAELVEEIKPDIVISFPLLAGSFEGSYAHLNYEKFSVPAISQEWQAKTGHKLIWGSPDLYIYVNRNFQNKDKISDYLVSQLNARSNN